MVLKITESINPRNFGWKTWEHKPLWFLENRMGKHKTDPVNTRVWAQLDPPFPSSVKLYSNPKLTILAPLFSNFRPLWFSRHLHQPKPTPPFHSRHAISHTIRTTMNGHRLYSSYLSHDLQKALTKSHHHWSRGSAVATNNKLIFNSLSSSLSWRAQIKGFSLLNSLN